jgi:hypothetical protein
MGRVRRRTSTKQRWITWWSAVCATGAEGTYRSCSRASQSAWRSPRPPHPQAHPIEKQVVIAQPCPMKLAHRPVQIAGQLGHRLRTYRFPGDRGHDRPTCRVEIPVKRHPDQQGNLFDTRPKALQPHRQKTLAPGAGTRKRIVPKRITKSRS